MPGLFLFRYGFTNLLIASFFLFGVTTRSLAQSDRDVFTIVEKPPSFPGGYPALWAYLERNVTMPPNAQAAQVKGRVLVSFIVEKDGRLTTFTLEQGLGYGCDEEAMRVARAMPNWEPGSQSGAFLRVKYQLHVLFGLPYPKQRKP